MAGAGNVYRRDYEDVEHKFIWQAIRHRRPELLEVVKIELKAILIGLSRSTLRPPVSPCDLTLL